MKKSYGRGILTAAAFAVSAFASLPAIAQDFGDAPDTGAGTGVGNYQTMLSDNGAVHLFSPVGPFFDDATLSGAGAPDSEQEGQPTVNADGDDNDGNDDEGGVSMPSALTPGVSAAATICVNAGSMQSAYVDIWVDFNKDGDWNDSGENIFNGQLPSGIHLQSFTVPVAALPGLTFLRARINSFNPLLPTGSAGDGEVEDHPVWIEESEQWPWKWLQEPDISRFGFDTECMKDRPILLADDFLCYQTAAITNIVIWGSWTKDILPMHQGLIDPRNVSFTISIHEDIPAGQQAPWSMPGDVLWWTNFPAGSFNAIPQHEQLDEGWYDPATSNYTPHADTICWLYEFAVPLAKAFVQTGTVENPVVYWLDVQADPLEDLPGSSRFGWKTTSPVDPDNRWNDDACWAPAIEPYNGFWWDMHYPPTHPYFQLENNSFDLAFMLVGGPAQIDWGDAPDTPYPTRAASGGANHMIVAGAPWLGDATDAPDADGNGQPTANADGDDNVGNDDEDGVRIPALAIGATQMIQFEVNGASGVVEGWIDFNGDGLWKLGAWPAIGEQVVGGTFAPGIHQVPVNLPVGTPIVTGTAFARFRVSTAGTGSPLGAAKDGEVEDHKVRIIEEPPPDPEAKWWQPPDLTELGVDVSATFTNLMADDFECTQTGAITRVVVWGSWRDNEYPPEGGPGSAPFMLSFHATSPSAKAFPTAVPPTRRSGAGCSSRASTASSPLPCSTRPSGGTTPTPTTSPTTSRATTTASSTPSKCLTKRPSCRRDRSKTPSFTGSICN